MKITIFSLIIILFTTNIVAQKNLIIKAQVIDKKTKKPLPNVNILAENDSTNSDENGQLTLHLTPNIRQKITLTHVGYETINKTIICTQEKNISFSMIPEDKSLDEVVITGTLTKKTLRNTPILTKIVSSEELNEIGAVTALDALQSIIPGIQFSPDAHGNNMTTQGLDNNYILVLLDGKRMVGETRGNVNFNRISTSDIKRIEIVNGASSVLYGSNAIGGVINIITKDVEENFEGEIQARYTKYNTWNSTLNIGLKKEKISLRISTLLSNSDGYDLTPTTPETFTVNPYKDYSGELKFKYKILKKISLETHARIFEHKSLNPPNSLKSTHRHYNNYTTGGKLNYDINKKQNLSLSINYDQYKAKTIYEKMSDSTSITSDYSFTNLLLSHYLKINDHIDITSGIETNYEKIFSLNLFGETLNTEEKIKKANDINIFTQADWKLLNNLELIGGIRYTHHSTFGDHFTPKLSAMYNLSHIKIRGTAALGYKSPSLKELYYNFDHQGMFWIFGNKNLKPENSTYFSLSGEYTKGNFNTSINLYNNKIDNKIDMLHTINKTTGKLEFKHYNITAAHIRGIETFTNWKPHKYLKLRLSYAYANAMDKSTGLQIYGISKHTGTAACSFIMNNIKTPFVITLSERIASPRLYQLEEEDYITGNKTIKKEESDAITITNISYIQTFNLYKKIKIKLKAGINNLFNYSDIERSAELNPGRTYWISLALRFF